MRRRVVVTGMGCITPLGNDVASTWDGVCSGRSGVGPITLFDASDLETQFAAEVKGFDPVAHFGRKDARRMDRFTQFAMVAALQAVAAARLQITDANRDEIGAYIGTGIGGVATLIEGVETLRTSGARRVSPFLVPLMLPDSGGAQVAIHLGIRGPNLAIVSACATGTNAIGEAVEVIRRGAAQVMLAGGAEAGIVRVALAGFDVMNALSRRNDAPERASRPFDLHRDGFVAAEGAGVLVLESFEHARARGAEILGEVLGYGVNNDAHHISAPSEDGSGAARCLSLALKDSGLTPTEIGYINAHGTSTPLNDRSETAAIKRAFGQAAYQTPVSSTKSMTGHLLGAAGGIEAIFSLLAIRDGLLPPTINYETPDPDCDLDYVPNRARRTAIRHAMSNSFGFGGHNACLVFGPAPHET
ncbi:MAG: beta-ketoacyl-ACP synthase II [Chloroflexi bacterium]|nr:beta-ketoacyl-ACP synthase II [Chloroflexota bacterium]